MKLTSELLDKSFAAVRERGSERIYIVSPRLVRMTRIGLAYLHGQLTRREYVSLAKLEASLLRADDSGTTPPHAPPLG